MKPVREQRILRAGNEAYEVDLAFSVKGIALRRAQVRAHEAVFALALGLGIFGMFGVGATLIFTGTLTQIGVIDFWLGGGQPVLALFAGSGLLFCYAWYKHRTRFVPSTHVTQNTIALTKESSVHHVRTCWDIATPDTHEAFEDAFLLADQLHHASVDAVHLFIAALSSPRAQTLLARLGVVFERIRDPLKRKLATLPSGSPAYGESGYALMRDALIGARKHRRTQITALDICAAAYAADPFLRELFEEQRIDEGMFTHALAWLAMQEELVARYHTLRSAALRKPITGMDRAMTARATPLLDTLGEDLTRKAVFGGVGLTVDRDAEIAQIFRAFEGAGRSVVLVGETGAGKMAIIEGIAGLMVEERVPKVLQDKRLVRLDIARIASAQGAGERLLYLLREIAHAGNVLVVIENVHQLVGMSGAGTDLSALLAGELSGGSIRALCTTTPSASRSTLDQSPLGSVLERIAVQVPEYDAALHMVEANVGYIEHAQGVVCTFHALAVATRLSAQFLTDIALPESALITLREAAIRAKSRGGIPCWVTHEDVEKIIEEKTHVPVSAATEDETDKLLHLEERIRTRVVGQEDAVVAVASAIRRARTAMRSQNRPIANFLFLGPTGVGKTELAKATAAVFFGDASHMIRFDMSEYQSSESVERLIGGNGEKGLLTEAVREQPFALLLLDELEKAHPDVLHVFLQVMDDGRLTDGTGRTVDFTNVILIATSNAGDVYIQDALTKKISLADIKETLLATELRAVYRPEFLNRFDDVIVFHPLTPEDVVAIAYLMVSHMVERTQEQGITLHVTDAALHEFAQLGYDPKFGARPLRRVLQEKIENTLADFLLRKAVQKRDTIVFDAHGDVRVEKAPTL